MAATAIGVAGVLVSATSTGVAIHNSNVQREQAEEDRRVQEKMVAQQDAQYKEQQNKSQKEKAELEKQRLSEDEKNRNLRERDMASGSLRNRKGSGGGRASTILTGPQGLVEDGSPKKTILGG